MGFGNSTFGESEMKCILCKKEYFHMLSECKVYRKIITPFRKWAKIYKCRSAYNSIDKTCKHKGGGSMSFREQTIKNVIIFVLYVKCLIY